MYNNFSSKKTKKVISALLASALVVTSAPITADAATTKVLGVNKTFSVSKKASAKVSGLSKAEKKIVNVTISKNKKKVTVKGKKAGSATFKVGSKSYTVRVTKVTSIKKKTFATTLTAKKNKNVSVTVNGTNVKYDKVTWTSSNKKVVAVSKATTTVSSKKVASNTLKPLKKGTATITVKSKATGKKLAVKVTVKAATPATTAPTTTPSVTPATTPAVSATPDATASATPATTPAVSADPTKAPEVSTTPAVSATPTASASATPATTPAVSATPDVSTNPAVSATPEVSTNPAVSATPEVTTAPAIVTAAAVSSAAVNVKTIAVTFNRELTKDEQDAVKVTVLKEKATQSVKAAFKTADTLYITRDTDLAFTEGTYNVELSGTVAYKADVKVEAQKATTLAVTSAVLEDEQDKATVKVSLKDQYGEEMTITDADFKAKTYAKTGSSVGGDLKFDSESKTFYIDTKDEENDNFKIDDVVNIVLLHKSGLTATATLKVVETTYVQEITLGAYVLPLGTTRLTEDVQKVLVPYTAKNNYGEEVTLATGQYSMVSTNTDVLDASAENISLYKDSNNKTYFEIKGFKKAGQTTLIVMNNKNAQTTKIDLDVQEKAGKPYAIQLDTTSVEVAQNSTAYVGLTVTDKYGDKVVAKDLTGDNALVYGSSNDNVLNKSNVAVVADENDENYGKLKIDATGAKENSTAVITITLPNGTNTTLQVKIGNAAVPTTIQSSASATTLVAGGKTEITTTIKDQYSSVVEYTALEGAGYTLATTVTEDDAKIVDVADPSTDGKITVTALKSGTAKVKVDLKKGETVVDTKTVTFTVEANTDKNLTYAVKEIPTLCKQSKATVGGGVMSDKDDYAKEIVVTGTKADGTVITLPASKILSVTSDNTNVAVAGIVDEKWYVAGKEVVDNKDTTVKLTIVVATDDGSTIINQNVTVSKDVAKTVAIKLYDKAATDEDKKELSSVEVDKYGDSITFNKVDSNNVSNNSTAFLYTVDQFGVEKALNDADAVSLSSFDKITGYSNDKFGYTKTALAENVSEFGTLEKTTLAGQAEAGASYKVTLVKEGVTATFTVKVKGENVAPKAKVTTATYAKVGDANTLTITFSEPVDSSKFIGEGNAISNLTVAAGETAHSFGTGATIAIATDATTTTVTSGESTVKYADKFVITLGSEAATVDAEDIISITAANVVDVNGNSAVANVEFTVPTME